MNRDKTFCASDCQDETCGRHKSFAPLDIKNTSFADLSVICKRYVKGLKNEDNK
jgi:hypothetical protein